MARRSSIIRVSVVGDATQLNQAFSQAQQSAQSFGQSMQNIGQSMTRNVTLPLTVGFTAAFRASEEQAKSEAKLNAVLKSTGGIAGITADHVKNLATQLQQTTLYGDETTITAANVLLTFKNLRNEVGRGNDIFDRSTKIMLDMSTALDMDLKSSAIQVGKALNDPITGLSMLTRVGITFTESQKDQIKALQESGDLLGAQRIILQELESQFQGTAQAVAETAGGQLKQAFNQLGDAGEEVGAIIAPMMADVAQGVKGAAQAFQDLNPETQEQIVKFGLMVAAAGPVLTILGKLATAYTAIRTAAAGAAAAQTAAAVAGGGAAAGSAGAAAGSIAAVRASASVRGAGLGAAAAGLGTVGVTAGGLLGAEAAANKLANTLIQRVNPAAETVEFSIGNIMKVGAWRSYIDQVRGAVSATEDAAGATLPYLNAQEEAARLTRLHAEEQSELQRLMRHLPDQVDGSTGAVQRFNDESRWFIQTLDDGSRILQGIGTDFSELGQAVANETPKILEGAGALAQFAAGARESVEQILALKAAAEGFAVDIGSLQTSGGPTGGRAAPRAGGGRFEKGQLMLVGEHGPELARFDSGGSVLTNQQSRRLAASGGGSPMPSGGSALPPIYIANVYGWDDFVRKVREAGVDINRLGWS